MTSNNPNQLSPKTMNNLNRLAIIPARGGSKRIPNKNIKPFCGVPMLERSLNLVSSSQLFSEIHVSTDSNEIYQLACTNGHKPSFMRPADLANDYSTLAEVTEYTLKKYQELYAQSFDEVWLILPCSPFLTSRDLAAIAELLDKYQSPIMTMARYCAPPQWSCRITANGLIQAINPDELKIRSQDLEERYYETGNIVAYPCCFLNGSMPSEYRPYLLPKHRSVDIDDNQDWLKAEALYRTLQAL